MLTWRRTIRPAIAWMLILLMTIDTAVACRLLARGSRCQTCCDPCQVYVVHDPCGVPVIPQTSVCCHEIESTSCGPSLTTPIEDTSVGEELRDETTAAQESTGPTIYEEPPTEAVEQLVDEADTPTPDAVVDDLLGEPEQKLDDAAADRIAEPETPAPDANSVEQALFDEPEQETADPDADVFAESETPATEPSSIEDDLFAEPEQKPDEAAEDLFAEPETPATDSIEDDLFAEPEQEPDEAAEDLFAEPETPATEPSSIEDDLFAEPEQEPDEAVLDLFDEPETPAPDAGSVEDDLFGEPDQKPDDAVLDLFDEPETTPDASSIEDDLFSELESDVKQPGETTRDSNAKNAEDAAPPEPTEGSDDLFGEPDEDSSSQTSTSRSRDMDDQRGNRLRTFVDNTGKYSCRGRLITVWGDQVKLLKDNGRTATFPMRRLSDLDRVFVEAQVAARPELNAVRTASSRP